MNWVAVRWNPRNARAHDRDPRKRINCPSPKVMNWVAVRWNPRNARAHDPRSAEADQFAITEGDELGRRAVEPTERARPRSRSAEADQLPITEGDELGSRAVEPTERGAHDPRSAEADQLPITEGDELGSRAVEPTEPTIRDPRKRINCPSPKVMNWVAVRWNPRNARAHDPRSAEADQFAITEGDELGSRAVEPTERARPRSAIRGSGSIASTVDDGN